MSLGKNTDHSHGGSPCASRAVTDSVHGRFRGTQIYCAICDLELAGNPTVIKTHFNDSHPSIEYCRYCQGKVFRYTQVPVSGLQNKDLIKEEVYHRCIRV